MSKTSVLYFIIFIFTWSYINCENCDHLGTLLYEDLGCRPKGAQNGSCPTHFECDDFTPSKDFCLFRGEHVQLGKEPNNTDLPGSCKQGCFCDLDEDKNIGRYVCPSVDCFETPTEDCYLTHELGKCCSVGRRCKPFDNISTCDFEGEKYMEGEAFYPKNTCLTCVCQKGFEGKLEAPFCQKHMCATQIDFAEELAKYCAPAYLGVPCCPRAWACPSSTDEIKKISAKSSEDIGVSCKWGQKTVKFGEGVETKVDHWGTIENVVCECVLPPLLTCKAAKK